MPVVVPQRRGEDTLMEVDEHPRHGTTMEDLSELRAAFKKGGSVTAGNASGVNDGAAALLLAAERAAIKHGLKPRAHCWCGCGRRSSANYGHWSGARNSQGI